jgi:hypothetical protein
MVKGEENRRGPIKAATASKSMRKSGSLSIYRRIVEAGGFLLAIGRGDG